MGKVILNVIQETTSKNSQPKDNIFDIIIFKKFFGSP